MPEYDVLLTPAKIDFAPQSELTEILQNVLTICTTMKYSVPLDRLLGIEGKFLDEPISKLRAEFQREIVQAVKKYEPRARVSRIDYVGSEGEKVTPRIRIKILG
ncbi:MAG: hypothetical protein IJP54_06615 [Synergistaceae bacterium]|nr:hypothetical protein [Synergistaceae bacterium]